MVLFCYEDSDMMIHHTVTDNPDEAAFPLHAHDRYELYCFLRGQGYYTVEGHDYSLSPGTLLIMRDGETHKLHISPTRPYERVALHFNPKILSEDSAASLLDPFRSRPLGQFNRLAASPETDRIRDMLIRITSSEVQDKFRQIMVHAYLPAILFEIFQNTERQENGKAAETVRQPSEEGTCSLTGAIIEFINRDPSAVTGIDVLEKKFGYSRSYLNRTFRQSTGVPIWEYVILKRLTAARISIRSGTAATIAAREAGYSDYSSFYRQYRKRFGCTPEDEKRGQNPDKKTDREEKQPCAPV